MNHLFTNVIKNRKTRYKERTRLIHKEDKNRKEKMN